MKEEYEDFAKYGIPIFVVSLILAFNLPGWVGEGLAPWAKGLIEWAVYFIASSVILVFIVFSIDTIIRRKHLAREEEKNKSVIHFPEELFEEIKEKETP